MKKGRLIALLLVIIAAAALLAVYNSSINKPKTALTTAHGTGQKIYRTYLTDECPILNGHNSVETQLQTPHDYCSSPLFRSYPNDEGTGYIYIGDLAEELPIKVDDHTWQIKIRKEACWHNGDPINADTMMYSFKMLLDPILVNRKADFLADFSIKIVNAKDYALQGTDGKVSWDDVGIKKIDEYTIEIKTVDANTSNDVCRQFTDRSCFPVYEPYYEAGMNASRTKTTYGTTLDNWMGCGPYKFTTWQYGNIHIYEKNPDHWLSDLFNYDSVEVRVISEMNARVELWEQGLLDYLIPDLNTIETYIDDPRMVAYDSLTVYHIDVNCKNPNNPVSGTVEYRKALYHAIDRRVLARDLFGYKVPTGTYVSGQAGILSENALTYRDSPQGQAVTQMVETWGSYGYNPELAREYLTKAYAASGVPDDTVITVIFAEDGDVKWKATAEFLKEEFPVIFEGKVKLEIVSHSGMSATDFKTTGDDKWDLSPNDWTRTVARSYPYTCFYYYTSSYGSSPNNYFVDEFDAQYKICDRPALKGDYGKMLDETKILEEIYLKYVIQIPVVQDIQYEMFSERLLLPVLTYIPGFGWGDIYGDISK